MARRAASEVKEPETAPLHPKLAERLIGHQAAELQLLALIHARKLPHALLISGPRGIGKATLAYRLARFLLAPPEPSGLFGEPEPATSLALPPDNLAFRRIVAGSHPDFLALEGDDIKIDEARLVPAFLSLTPAEGTSRVVLIDSIDAMNRNAANALLKTLEEPPARTVMLLISHNPGLLLPTIRSRCRALRLPPLTPEAFMQVMMLADPAMTQEQARLWAIFSAGSPGLALELASAKADGVYADLVRHMHAPDAIAVHGFADRFARKEASRAWDALVYASQLMFKRLAAGTQGDELFTGEAGLLAALRARRPLGYWLDAAQTAAAALADADRLYLDKKQTVLELLSQNGA